MKRKLTPVTRFTGILSTFSLIAGIALFAAVILGGCSKADDKTLYIYNWTYYTPDSVIEKFEQEYGVKVVLDYFASNEDMFAKLKAGGSGYDIVFPSGDYVSIMKKEQMLEKIDSSKIPNLTYISQMVLDKATYDPTMEYSVPYYMGAAGIAVNKTKVSDYTRTWDIFGDTRLAGRMSMLDDMREVLGDALAHLGYSVNTVDPSQLEEAKRLVLDTWKPNLVKFDAEAFGKSFASGEFWVVQGYPEAVFGEVDPSKWDEVDFFLPASGGPMYLDSMCIPKGAKHIDLAHTFINFIHRPEIYAEFLDFFNFPSSVNTAAGALMTATPFYGVDDLANYELKDDIGEGLDLYNEIWQDIRFAE